MQHDNICNPSVGTFCKRCGNLFECQVDNINQCQCKAVQLSYETRNFLEKTVYSCLCKDCLVEIDNKIKSLANEKFPKPGNLIEQEHYYLENGLFVFTEKYHLLRGQCCKSGCRHCPYGFKKNTA